MEKRITENLINKTEDTKELMKLLDRVLDFWLCEEEKYTDWDSFLGSKRGSMLSDKFYAITAKLHKASFTIPDTYKKSGVVEWIDFDPEHFLP